MKTSRLFTLALVTLATTATFALGAETASDHGGEHAAESSFITQTLVSGVTAMLVFLISLAILAKFAWGPILKGLNTREQKIRSDIDRAEQARIDAEKILATYKQQVANADSEIRDKLAAAQKDAEGIATRLRQQAQTEIEDQKNRAARDIEDAKRGAIAEVHAESAMLGVAIASKVLKRQINENDQAELIRSGLDELQSARR